MNHSIDLRQLRYFVALSETLHFGRAATELHISQPPLSRQIQQLEDALGVALFHRGRAAITLTNAGAAFLPEVRRTLAQAEKAVAVARAAQPAHAASAGQFVLGYTTVFDRSAIPDVLEPLRQQFPDWRITVRGKRSIGLVRDVRNGAMDAAFIGLHTEAPGLVLQVVREEPLVVALPSGHALARRRQIALGELAAPGCPPLFWFERRLNPGFYDRSQAYFDRVGFAPRLAPEPVDHHITLGLIAEGRGVALIPASMRQVRRQGVVFRPLKLDSAEPGGLTMGVALAYRADCASPLLGTLLTLSLATASTVSTGSARTSSGSARP
ncbi:MAG: transcriptional regulator [Rhodoferax sp.]|nr:transcriptional regulator [Rhodoferax sp.]